MHRLDRSVFFLGELLPVGGGDPIPLLKKSLLVGRRESCDIVLRFSNVSAHHCQLTLTGGYWPAYLFGADYAINVPISNAGAGLGGNAHAANEFYVIEGAGKVYGMAGAEEGKPIRAVVQLANFPKQQSPASGPAKG